MRPGLEILFLLLFGLALVIQIFIPPYIGIADNGDFARIIDKVGIKPGADKSYMEYINLTFPIEFRYNLKGYQSSELIFVLVSIALNSVLFRDGQFHLLVLAAVHSLAWLASLGLVAYGLAGLGGRWRWAAYACLLVFFTDVGYVAYLNSLYSEPATLIFLTLMLGLFLVNLRRSVQGEMSWGWVALFLAAGFLFVIAKPQNAAMGILVAALGYRLCTALKLKGISPRMGRSLGVGAALGTLVASFLFFAFGLPEYYRSGDLWNSIFLEIVGRSETPERDLEILGLPQSMIIYKGTNAFSEGVNRNEYEQFQHSWLYFGVLKFYLINPGRLLDLLDLSVGEAFELQQANLGNFEQSSGKEPLSKSQQFALWNDLRVKMLPDSQWTLFGLLVLHLGALGIKRRQLDRTLQARLVSELHLGIVLMAVLQYLTVLMAEGTFELVKHMLLFNFLADIGFVFLIVYLVWGVMKLAGRVKRLQR
jgi:hypothetical protein